MACNRGHPCAGDSCMNLYPFYFAIVMSIHNPSEEPEAPDVSLYVESPEKYNDYQYRRPDYTRAIQTTLSSALRFLEATDPSKIVMADFCGGTGNNTKQLTEKLGKIQRAVIIDINQEFLRIAQESGIQTSQLDTLCQNILDLSPQAAGLKGTCDLVLSTFAYHHIPDEYKELYVRQLSECLAPGGVAVITEIYLPTGQDLAYYRALYDSIPAQLREEGLERFLTETALSSNFEFKVPKAFLNNQIAQTSLQIADEQKVWPKESDHILDELFSDPHVGTFVQVVKKTV